MQLGRLGLALERAQARTRLALDVERAVEVLLGALELQLGAAAALAVLAEPRRLLDQQPAIARLGGDDRLDAALRDDRVGLLAEAGVGEQLEHVDQPAARAVRCGTRRRRCGRGGAGSRSRWPARRSARRRCRGPARPPLRERAWTPRPPAKITSCIDWPRTASGDCSPSAHSTASVMFDLPEPLGPTITLTPSPNSSRVRSGNDLKPLIVIDFRCIRCSSPRPAMPARGDCRPARRAPTARRHLLCVLLAAPEPRLESAILPDRASTTNIRSCGGPCSSITS